MEKLIAEIHEIIKDYTSGFSNSNIGYYLCKN